MGGGGGGGGGGDRALEEYVGMDKGSTPGPFPTMVRPAGEVGPAAGHALGGKGNLLLSL